MKPSEYVELTGVTDHTDEQADVMAARMRVPENARLLHYALGLCTEVGELQDALKKYVAYGKPIDATNFKEELGDILWYHARLMDFFGLSYESVMETNINKLKKRYGDKFTEHAALNRDLDGERQILEQ
jgi:NTP pyrophosphatase (non-canonical NTP hydrolase)